MLHLKSETDRWARECRRAPERRFVAKGEKLGSGTARQIVRPVKYTVKTIETRLGLAAVTH